MITFSILARSFAAVAATSARRGSLEARSFSSSVLDIPLGYHPNTKGARENWTKLRFARLTVPLFAEGAGRSPAFLGDCSGPTGKFTGNLVTHLQHAWPLAD